MKKHLVLFLIAMSPLMTKAQEKFLSNPKEIGVLTERIVDLFMSRSLGSVASEIVPYQYGEGLTKDQLLMRASGNFNGMQSDIKKHQFENPQTYFKSGEEKLGDIGLRQTYLVQYERTIVKITFVFIKSTEGWYNHSFEVSDDFESEFM